MSSELSESVLFFQKVDTKLVSKNTELADAVQYKLDLNVNHLCAMWTYNVHLKQTLVMYDCLIIYFADSAAPKNLRNMTQSVGDVIFFWDPGSTDCSEANYSVQTSNCGNCGNLSRNTTFTNITCEELTPEQQCNISIQSVFECGALSKPVTLVYMYKGMIV